MIGSTKSYIAKIRFAIKCLNLQQKYSIKDIKRLILFLLKSFQD